MFYLKKPLRFVPLLILTGFLFVGSTFAQSEFKLDGIIIETNAKHIDPAAFKAKITLAFELLKTQAPSDYATMKSFIGKIRTYQASGANFNEDIMTIDIAKATFDASLEWLTSVLAHETTHIKKYKDTGKKFGDAHLLTDKKAALLIMINEELDCNKVQLAVLEKVGGAKYEIDYLRAQKGDHFDIDKDGDYDMDDYKGRKW